MKLTMRLAAVTVVVLIGLFVCLNTEAVEQTDTAAIEKAVLNTYDEMTLAAEKVDAQKLFSYVLENDKGSQISNGKIMSRQQSMENYIDGSANVTAVDYVMDKKYVTVISPEAAIMVVEGRYEVKTADGQTFGSPMAQTIVFVLKGKEWKVLHSHNSVPVNG